MQEKKMWAKVKDLTSVNNQRFIVGSCDHGPSGPSLPVRAFHGRVTKSSFWTEMFFIIY